MHAKLLYMVGLDAAVNLPLIINIETSIGTKVLNIVYTDTKVRVVILTKCM